jgi:hypothetical protein
MTNRILVETFNTRPPLSLIFHGFEFTEQSPGEVANKISNFRRFYGERVDNIVVVYSVCSKRHPHDLLVVFTTGSGSAEPPFALATFYTKVSNLNSDNPNDRKDVGQYILADNVRISDASDAPGFTEKVNQKAFEILQRINGF